MRPAFGDCLLDLSLSGVAGGQGASLALPYVALGDLLAKMVAWSALGVSFPNDNGEEDPPRWDVILGDGVAALCSLVEVVLVGVVSGRVLEECRFCDSNNGSGNGIFCAGQCVGAPALWLPWWRGSGHRWLAVVVG